MQEKRDITSYTKCYDVKASCQGKKFFSKHSHILYHSKGLSFIAEHFFLKDDDLKIPQKRNIWHFLKLCNKKKSKAKNHWNYFFSKHTQIKNQ